MNLGLILRRYGQLDLTPAVIAGDCSSIDLRVLTGAPPKTPDETCVVPPGVFARSLFAPSSGSLPVGEIRIWVAGKDVRLVADPTQRQGLIEVTLAHLEGAGHDRAYHDQLVGWLSREN